MYQIRDSKQQRIIARFLLKKDAIEFFNLKEKEEKDRYVLIEAGKRGKDEKREKVS